MKSVLKYLLNKEWILSIVMMFISDEKKEAIYMARLRAELMFFGFDTSDMTDKEIKDGFWQMSITMSALGLSADELSKAMIQIGQSLKPSTPNEN